jgi:hypothetical protein
MKHPHEFKKRFQESLEDFEVQPDEALWLNIKDKLQEKKKRRVIPIWWFYSGIAAAFLVGLFIRGPFWETVTPSSPETNPVVVNDPGKANSSSPSVTNGKNSMEGSEDQEAVTTLPNKATSVPSSPVVTTSAQVKNKLSNGNTEVAFSSKKERKNMGYVVQAKNSLVAHQAAVGNGNSNQPVNNNSTVIPEKQQLPQPIPASGAERLAVNPEKTLPSDTTNPVTNAVTPSPLVSNTPLHTAKDSTAVAEKSKNALEELLHEKEKKTFSEPKLNRWLVGTQLAPIYFSSLSQGSPLDPSLTENEKRYTAENFSYGLGVGYALNDKLTLRSGVNMVRLGYETDGIMYYMRPEVSSRIQNISLNAVGSNIVIESLNNVRPYNRMTEMFEGSIVQRTGYLEIPLELAYQFGSKKWGLQVLGGMSTFVLNQNEVYLQSNTLNLLIGEATNLNPVHFSGNLGLGMHYRFFKNWQARVEPTFKYQFNPYRSDAGNFRPYLMGLYTGVVYTF